MGGGYSNQFVGTAGAIGDNRHHQLSFEDTEPVRAKLNIINVDVSGGAGANLSPQMKQCFCCGEYSLLDGSEFEICPICGWIDDAFQNHHSDSTNGRNPISLDIAREEYRSKTQSNPTT